MRRCKISTMKTCRALITAERVNIAKSKTAIQINGWMTDANPIVVTICSTAKGVARSRKLTTSVKTPKVQMSLDSSLRSLSNRFWGEICSA